MWARMNHIIKILYFAKANPSSLHKAFCELFYLCLLHSHPNASNTLQIRK
jgi:hypothetical protein